MGIIPYDCWCEYGAEDVAQNIYKQLREIESAEIKKSLQKLIEENPLTKGSTTLVID